MLVTRFSFISTDVLDSFNFLIITEDTSTYTSVGQGRHETLTRDLKIRGREG